MIIKTSDASPMIPPYSVQTIEYEDDNPILVETLSGDEGNREEIVIVNAPLKNSNEIPRL